MYIIAGLERVMTLIIHMGLTLIVLYGIRLNQIKYLFYAIALHSLVDIIPALYQIKVVQSVWIAEGFVLLFAIFFGYVVFRLSVKLGEDSPVT